MVAVMLVESRRGVGVEFDDPSVAHNRADLARRYPAWLWKVCLIEGTGTCETHWPH